MCNVSAYLVCCQRPQAYQRIEHKVRLHTEIKCETWSTISPAMAKRSQSFNLSVSLLFHFPAKLNLLIMMFSEIAY